MAIFPLIASSLVGGLFGRFQQGSYLRSQSLENEYAFERNRQLAQDQNAFNVAQWNRENEYNLPINQIKRLKDAGINPHLAFSNGVSGLTSATSPTMSAGSPYTPVDYTMNGQRRTIADNVNQSLDLALKKAQIDNINSLTNKTYKETEGISINNATLYEMNTTEIKKRLSEIGYNEKNVEYLSQKIEESKSYVEEISASIKEKFANIDNLTFQQYRSMLQYDLDKSLNDATINKIVAETSLTREQLKQMKDLLPSIMSKYSAEISLINSQTAVNGQTYHKIVGEIALDLSKKMNLDADTDAKLISNARSRDELQRYENLWGVNKDILFSLKEIFQAIK